MFFLLGFQKHWYLQCFVHLGSKKYWYLQHFLRFCMAPANDVKTQKCCNLQHFVTSEKRKIVRKMCQNGTFFRFLGPPKRIFKFHPLFVHPRPRKTWKPHQAKGFLGGSAAGARPRVAKAMLSFPTLHGEASPDYKRAPPLPPTPEGYLISCGVVISVLW